MASAEYELRRGLSSVMTPAVVVLVDLKISEPLQSEISLKTNVGSLFHLSGSPEKLRVDVPATGAALTCKALSEPPDTNRMGAVVLIVKSLRGALIRVRAALEAVSVPLKPSIVVSADNTRFEKGLGAENVSVKPVTLNKFGVLLVVCKIGLSIMSSAV